MRGAAFFHPRTRPLVAVVACLLLAGSPSAAPVVGAGSVRAQAGSRPQTKSQAKPPAARPAAAKAAVPVPAKVSNPRRRTIVIDAGHGGRDRGMTGVTSSQRRIYEKDIALDVARRVARRIEAAGVNVVMTRTTDTLIALHDRGRIANKQQGDLFISLHVNAANPKWRQSGGARGFETYFLAEARTEDERRVAQMENEVVQFDTEAERPTDGALSFMFNDMVQNEHLRESSELAATIQARLRGAHPGPNRGVKQAGFLVLVRAFMPAVLVEIGFGTNRAEADWMASTAGQAELAEAIAAAALDYLARYERRVSGGSAGGSK